MKIEKEVFQGKSIILIFIRKFSFIENMVYQTLESEGYGITKKAEVRHTGNDAKGNSNENIQRIYMLF